jgi:uncharacterized protein
MKMQTTLEQFREQKDRFFKTHEHSPLTPDQQQHFAGLRYFPANSELRIVAPIERVTDQTPVIMQTSTGDTATYTRYGRVQVAIDGQLITLTVYANDQTLFLPFVDALAGSETYAAGRYLEPELLEHDRVLIDFNRAYNPYCAYNDQWSCPITPPENRLPVPIRAGEKLFTDSTSDDR